MCLVVTALAKNNIWVDGWSTVDVFSEVRGDEEIEHVTGQMIWGR